ncbi:hypothetical protein OIE66_42160 [Nonomuraea sp. NBC_01738]|uniref:hypothetical protein n=1 Tax=Nonomuraea sp. NBC_01738 TaxID=2976003 RepID=UPI002E0FA6C9|nr:hypothetical protein OIE66_42160 [Nonomuraea sp. NBC_01738]
MADAKPPTPGGEVGSASTEFASAAELPVWLKLSDTEDEVDRLSKLEIKNGSLIVEPKTSAWFDGFRGPFVYQELAGDIAMHMRVKVEGKKGGKPKRKFSLGGAMVRVPNSDAKPNWFSVTTGTADKSGQVEVKQTKDGGSKPQEITVKDGWIEFVLARAGRAMVALYKEEGGQWKIGRRWPSEMPQVLQWGITAYADWESFLTLKKNATKANTQQIKGKPDLKMTVDYVRFLRPEIPEWADPLNTASVPDPVMIKLMTPAGA